MSKIWTPWYIYVNDEEGNWIPAQPALYDEVMCREVQADGEWMTLDVATNKVFFPMDPTTNAAKKAEVITRIITLAICDHLLKSEPRKKGQGQKINWTRVTNGRFEEFHLYDAILNFFLKENERAGSMCGKLLRGEDNIFRITISPF
jgi:hypothetical protein